jgi:WD40 repeat protein
MSPDGMMVGAATMNGRVYPRCMEKTSERIEFGTNGDAPQLVSFSPDSRRMGVGYASGRIDVWNISQRPVSWHSDRPADRTLRSHAASINSLAFSADRSNLASCDADGTAKLSDLQNTERRFALHDLVDSKGHEPRQRSEGSSDEPNSVAVSEDTTMRHD